MRLLCLILIVLLVSCTKEKYNSAQDSLLPEATIEIVDSIFVHSDSTWIQYYNTDQFHNGFFLGYDRISNKLQLFDQSGNFLNEIGSQGEGPESYLSLGSFNHFSPDSIFIADFGKANLSLYNKDGAFVNSWNFNLFDTLNSLPEYYNNGNLHIFYENKNDLKIEYAGWSLKRNYLTTPEYYEEAQLLSSLSLKDSIQIDHYISYPEDSPYRKGMYMLSFFDPFVKRLNNGMYLIVYGHDDRLFLFNENKELIKIINCNSIHFPEPKGVSFDIIDKNFIVDQVKFNYKHNAINYLNLIEGKGNFKGNLFKQYQAPMGENSDVPENLNAIYSKYYRRDSYLQVFDENYNKVFKDIIQPEILKTLLYVDEFSNLIFSSNNKLTDDNILYIAKINSI